MENDVGQTWLKFTYLKVFLEISFSCMVNFKTFLFKQRRKNPQVRFGRFVKFFKKSLKILYLWNGSSPLCGDDILCLLTTSPNHLGSSVVQYASSTEGHGFYPLPLKINTGLFSSCTCGFGLHQDEVTNILSFTTDLNKT